MNLLKTFLSFSALTLCSVYSGAQITVDSSPTAIDLVTNTLIGPGVNVSNITFTGQATQKGRFTAGTSNIGLTGGIMFSSGDVNDCVPPNNPSTGFGGAGDADVLATAQSVTTNPESNNISTSADAAVLEFDFVPDGSVVSFSFVFASAEYTTWVNSVYNDAFGFYISGPNPSGGSYNMDNLAVVPGTNEPITISTIYPFIDATNPGLNEQYYIGTPTGHSFPGFTIPIEISFPVVCGEVYHFKFAVADCGEFDDDILDTGVFLEEGSFQSNPIALSTESQTSDNSIIEGCADLKINFERDPCQAINEFSAYLTYGGTIDLNQDFVSLPDSVYLAVGQTLNQLTLIAQEDNVTEGNETIIIYAAWEDAYGNPYFDTLQFVIKDGKPRATFSTSQELGCDPQNIQFTNESAYSLSFNWIVDNNAPVTTVGNQPFTGFISHQSTLTLVAKNEYPICNDTIQETFIFPTCIAPPNVFTPNNDGANDFYFIQIKNYISIEVSILDRWGNVIFSGSGDSTSTPSWNGQTKNGNPANEGVYFYKYNAINSFEEEVEGHGFLELIRD